MVLHIGSPKTGTSAIQTFLAQNYDALNKSGIIYPGKGKSFFTNAQQGKISSGNGVNIAKYFRNPNNKQNQNAYSEFCKYITSQKKRCLLYSSEAFWNLKKQHLQMMYDLCKRNNYNVKIILYLRNQKEMLIASYAQAIKSTSFTSDIYTYYRRKKFLLDYKIKLDMLSEVFGKKNLKIFCYTRDGLIENFLNALDLNQEQKEHFKMISYKVNPTPHKYELAFLQSVNQLKEHDRSFSDRLTYLQRDSKEKLSLPNDLCKEMEKRYLKTNKFIAEEYGIVISNACGVSDQNIQETENMSVFDEVSAKLIFSLHEDVGILQKQLKKIQKKYVYLQITLTIIILVYLSSVSIYFLNHFHLSE